MYGISLKVQRAMIFHRTSSKRDFLINSLPGTPEGYSFDKKLSVDDVLNNIVCQFQNPGNRMPIKLETCCIQKNVSSKNTSLLSRPKRLFPQEIASPIAQKQAEQLQTSGKLKQSANSQLLISSTLYCDFIQNNQRNKQPTLRLKSSFFLSWSQKLPALNRIIQLKQLQTQQCLQDHLTIDRQKNKHLKDPQNSQNQQMFSSRSSDFQKQSQKTQSTVSAILQNQQSMNGISLKMHQRVYKAQSSQSQNNSEGAFKILSTELEEKAFLLLREVNKKLRNSNILVLKLYWSQQLEFFLRALLKNYEVYEYEGYQALYLFLRLNQYKMFNLSCEFQEGSYSSLHNLYEKLYPGITCMVNALLQKLQVKSIVQQHQLFLESVKSNIQFVEIRELSQKQQLAIFLQNLRNTYKINKETPAQQTFLLYYKAYLQIFKHKISKIDNSFQRNFDSQLDLYLQQTQRQFHHRIKISEIAISIRSFISEDLSLLKPKEKKKKLAIEQSANQIQMELVNQSNCLGCTQAFVINKIIHDDTISDIPIKTFPTIHKLKDYEVDFKDTICAMLNNGGGIIIFDCDQISSSIYPRGDYLTQKDKEEIQQRITSYFRWFYPRPEINLNIKITFVPLMANNSPMIRPQEANEGQIYSVNPKKSNYLEGVYITRLRIAPSEGTIVYFWFHTKKQARRQDKQDISLKYCTVLGEDNKPKLINFRQMRRLIKKKIKEWYIPPESSSINHLLMQKTVNIFGHQCYQPEKGQLITKKLVQPEVKMIPQQLPSSKVKMQTEHNFESKFSQMALLIARKEDLQRIKAKLRDSGIDCQIQVRFANYNFKPANNAAVLYHEKTFQAVYQLISKDPRFRFSTGKPFMVVNVTKYLRFQFRNQHNKLNNEVMLKYRQWFKEQFPKDSIHFYEYHFDAKIRQYYLQTSSRISLLFMYFKLIHTGEKVSLKNPFNIQKYIPEEKMNRFQKLAVKQVGQVGIASENMHKFKGKQQSTIFEVFQSQSQENFSNFLWKPCALQKKRQAIEEMVKWRESIEVEECVFQEFRSLFFQNQQKNK